MKVLASLKPYYYYLVGEGIKKIEVRKGEPKAKDWDRDVLFYMSKDEKSFAEIPKELQEKYRKHFGKVGLEFICDEIQSYTSDDIKFFTHIAEESCVSKCDLLRYKGEKQYLYGWHISNLKIYDKPKELSEFKTLCYSCGYQTLGISSNCKKCSQYAPLTRPPQSLCYVEI